MSGSGLLLLFLSSSVIFLLMGLALVLFVMRYQRRVMQQEEAFQAAKAKQQVQLLKATLASQEKERQRIASELHDGLGAQLSSIRLQLLMHGQENEGSLAFTEETAKMLSESIQVVREISHDLLPEALRSHGLSTALEALFRPLSKSHGLEAILQEDGTPQDLSDSCKLGIYRIAQELMNNTLRHAKAGRLGLSLHWSQDWLDLQYADDGEGFDTEVASGGLGTYNLKSRAQALGASLGLTSQPGEGMQCSIKIPLNNENLSQ